MKQTDLIALQAILDRIDAIDVRASSNSWATARLFQALKAKGILSYEEIHNLLDPDRSVPAEPEKQGFRENDAHLLLAQQQCIRNLRDQVLGIFERRSR